MKLGERDTTQDNSGNNIFTTRFTSMYENNRTIFPKGGWGGGGAFILMEIKIKDSTCNLKGCPMSVCKAFGYKDIFLALEDAYIL